MLERLLVNSDNFACPLCRTATRRPIRLVEGAVPIYVSIATKLCARFVLSNPLRFVIRLNARAVRDAGGNHGPDEAPSLGPSVVPRRLPGGRGIGRGRHERPPLLPRERDVSFGRRGRREVVVDGTNGQVGPFETALGEFYTGNVLPVAAGAFSEVNEDASKLITRLARLTAKTDFGKSMSPLVSHSRKGGAFPIMQSQFRRALGCLIARGQAQHLLKRRHYARPTAREAYQTAEDNHSRHRNRPRASMSGYARWWQNFIPEGYGLYQQWRNGKNFGSL
ncbi:hypothetical protein THAOC_26179 [Thalassiosira oceanica]|uniref:Uncharacterized protein n=1 Tax=Thalassiosira oceanica TaxID=159749 RepID=K0RZP7_THAOC|nr:hypothetical protein THAOC_26179 [Thalassiosira oceanica]|eukprot:EJK54221.1 hypothetical protein THAOC_26179 [Thalassiosira oceanica]